MPKQRTKANMADLPRRDRRNTDRRSPADSPANYYQLVVRGAVQKTEIEYSQTVSQLLTEMKLAGELEWSWIVDNSRRTHCHADIR